MDHSRIYKLKEYWLKKKKLIFLFLIIIVFIVCNMYVFQAKKTTDQKTQNNSKKYQTTPAEKSIENTKEVTLEGYITLEKTKCAGSGSGEKIYVLHSPVLYILDTAATLPSNKQPTNFVKEKRERVNIKGIIDTKLKSIYIVGMPPYARSIKASDIEPI